MLYIEYWKTIYKNGNKVFVHIEKILKRKKGEWSEKDNHCFNALNCVNFVGENLGM